MNSTWTRVCAEKLKSFDLEMSRHYDLVNTKLQIAWLGKEINAKQFNDMIRIVSQVKAG